ncbi:TetR/AcrR family transcriptional regulator [Actinacidiphila acididurans]|uniref:TetR/AcrR family transcriptional regulator n=1 Tax=Actinacidiphila acididurans TaxID=2784346 RepID=A0ABS2TWR2_9ACTN|nr:TetR/AcrR family transcriptional regulator [Actinacidiphila acididurans]MBM9507406.1 TetR/AcrR family transcriptional regulator [Actinacidiphila acididurans]
MSRTTYHHGDLANALVDAGVGLARTGGPEAVVLREAARRAGVSATAAYRHFSGQQDLLEHVKQRALAMLAARITAALDAVPPAADPGETAVARLVAAGWAYTDFARTEPGCFATAFRRTTAEPAGPLEGAGGDPAGGPGEGSAANSGDGSGGSSEASSGKDDGLDDDGDGVRDDAAFSLLGGIVDELVAAGRMPEETRPDAEYAAWAAVHGVSVLLLDGPLRHLDTKAQEAVIDRTIRLVVDGLAGPGLR